MTIQIDAAQLELASALGLRHKRLKCRVDTDHDRQADHVIHDFAHADAGHHSLVSVVTHEHEVDEILSTHEVATKDGWRGNANDTHDLIVCRRILVLGLLAYFVSFYLQEEVVVLIRVRVFYF